MNGLKESLVRLVKKSRWCHGARLFYFLTCSIPALLGDSENALGRATLPVLSDDKPTDQRIDSQFGILYLRFVGTHDDADGTTEAREVKPQEGTVVLAPDVWEYFPD